MSAGTAYAITAISYTLVTMFALASKRLCSTYPWLVAFGTLVSVFMCSMAIWLLY